MYEITKCGQTAAEARPRPRLSCSFPCMRPSRMQVAEHSPICAIQNRSFKVSSDEYLRRVFIILSSSLLCAARLNHLLDYTRNATCVPLVIYRYIGSLLPASFECTLILLYLSPLLSAPPFPMRSQYSWTYLIFIRKSVCSAQAALFVYTPVWFQIYWIAMISFSVISLNVLHILFLANVTHVSFALSLYHCRFVVIKVK